MFSLNKIIKTFLNWRLRTSLEVKFAGVNYAKGGEEKEKNHSRKWEQHMQSPMEARNRHSKRWNVISRVILWQAK